MQTPGPGRLGTILYGCSIFLGIGAAQAGAQTESGLGYIPQNSTGLSVGQSRMAVVPTAVSNGSAASRNSDPLGQAYVYGGVYGAAAIPMTQQQMGFLMLSQSQQMLGLGNGRLSGVRPQAAGGLLGGGAGPAGKGEKPTITAAHTRDSNIPGGQAARFFHRPRTNAQAVSQSQPYYNREMRFFPQRGRY